MSREAIKVCCRFRKYDYSAGDFDNWTFDEENRTIYYGEKNTKGEKKWTYDYILPPETTQQQMYELVAKQTIIDFTEGYNGTIFAYGQSGSGKTYSMLGPDSVLETLATSKENELYGITPRAVYQIFNIFQDFERSGTRWQLKLSYIEIYQEKIKCLLSKSDGLKIREKPGEGFVVPDKKEIECLTPLAVFEGINLASRNRATGATNQNERSSRSHAILQLELIYNSIDGLVRKSKLSLVDLAGSERIAKTGAEGKRLEEAKKINQSLTTLGMVIMSLTTSGSKYIPFRNSKLTLILKDSLGGTSKTTLLCTASGLKVHTEESIQTLYFASRATKIENKATKNIILSAGELQYLANGLKKEIMLLRGQIKSVGYQWRLIEDKKILKFCSNDEFLSDPNSMVEALTIPKSEEKIDNENIIKEDNEIKKIEKNEKIEEKNEEIIEKKNEKKEETKEGEQKKEEKKSQIENQNEEEINENKYLRLIINDLYDKLNEKEDKIKNLLKDIEEIKNKKDDDKNPTIITPIDLSQFEREKNDIQLKKNEEINTLRKEKQYIEEQNISISQENQKLREKIKELKLYNQENEIKELKKQMMTSIEPETKKKTRDKSCDPKSKNILQELRKGLKKVKEGVDYLNEEKKQNELRQKAAELIWKDNEEYQALHKHIKEDYDSPLTVSSNNDILEIDLPELNFANNNNDEEIKKIEEELRNKELEHKLKKMKEKEKEKVKEIKK